MTNAAVYPAAAAGKSLQSCPALCDPIDGSPPGSTVPGVLQARTLERVAILFSSSVSYCFSKTESKISFLKKYVFICQKQVLVMVLRIFSLVSACELLVVACGIWFLKQR